MWRRKIPRACEFKFSPHIKFMAPRPKFKDKFKALSLKFRRSGAVRRSEISHKSGAEFWHAEAKFKAKFKAKFCARVTDPANQIMEQK